MKGIIALDIDGTVTTHSHSVDRVVVDYLQSLSRDGWLFIFLTGRSFSWGYSILKNLPFSYYLAVHNGVIALEMPSGRVLFKKYLSQDILPMMDTICLEEDSQYIIYSGCAYDDYSYLCPSKFPPALMAYILGRYEKSQEPYRSLSSFADLPITDFAAIKLFSKGQAAKQLAQKMEQQLHLHVPLIRDPFDRNYYVLQGTHGDVNKGSTLACLKAMLAPQGPVLAAGDDNNDFSMLQEADISIAMATAPVELKRHADIIAPAASGNGIIAGLKMALKRA